MYQDNNPSSSLSLPASRARLAAVFRASREIVSIGMAAKTLGVEQHQAAKLLSRWREQGWLRRIGPGLYVPVPLELASSQQVVEDPWVLVPSLFGQSYIGGWTAAHHWELTEQLFNEILVFSTRRAPEKYTAQGVTFRLRQATEKRFFGLKTIWRGATRVMISDAARTLIDMLANPDTGGGIDHVADCIGVFLESESAQRELLIDYAKQYGNGAIFKRLGYLADTRLHDEQLSAACRANLTKGYARLDPTLTCEKLATSWRLWVPANDR
ncbi:MAG: type IV toxin-antitoxin system AbiEi family antitoxin domain-containing protein [Candidatus Obscuribacterales bacterium]